MDKDRENESDVERIRRLEHRVQALTGRVEFLTCSLDRALDIMAIIISRLPRPVPVVETLNLREGA